METQPVNSIGPNYPCLLLDFGGVCLLNPVELHAKAERLLNLNTGTLDWLGPIDPSTDPLWQKMVAGDGLTEREYWATRAAEVGEQAGREMTTRDYMRLLYEPAEDTLVRAECVDVVARAQAAGVSVSILTNDMRAFHGREWEHDIALLGQVEHIVDCSDTGILKPDPRAFARAFEMTGFGPEQMLFVDDQPLNGEGADAVGIDWLWFDIANAATSWDAVATTLGV